MATFGQKVRKLRTGHGWSQDKFGEMVGIHGRHVGKYETGKAMPNADTIVKIAQALNVSIDFLLRNDLKNTASDDVLTDQELIKKFKAVEGMPEKDRHIIISLIDAYIKKHQIEEVLSR